MPGFQACPDIRCQLFKWLLHVTSDIINAVMKPARKSLFLNPTSIYSPVQNQTIYFKELI